MHEEIKDQKMVPYTPQQNGVAKQMNHTIRERARSMLNTFGLDNGFQEKVVNPVAYFINRSPTIALDGNIL